MGMMKEFREFAMRGNVVDLAVGIIIGGAFGKIVTSFVNDIIMPPVGIMIGGVDFKQLAFPLKYAADGTVSVAIKYGAFINTLLDFLIVAFCIFLMIKGINSMKKKEPEKVKSPNTKECPHCLSQVPLKAIKCAFCTSELKAKN